jgi:ABC-type antimicrobial peptide transport system permease subunit
MQDNHHLHIGEMFRLASRNFRVKPLRAFLTVLGMSVGFGVVLFLVSLGYGLQYILIGNLVTTQDSLVTMQASFPSEANISLSAKDLKNIAELPNIAEVSPVASFSGEVLRENSRAPALMNIQIVEPAYFRLTGAKVSSGVLFSTSTPGLIVTSQTLALMGLPTTTNALQTKLNVVVHYEDTLHGTSTESRSSYSIPIVGIISDDTIPPLVTLYSEELTTPPPFFQSVLVKASSVDTVESVRTQLINKGMVVSARIDLVKQARQITNIITLVLGVFGITALIVSAIGMFNTMIVSFMERTYEVGVLKSIGAKDTDVRNLFLLESAMMGFLGGSGGVVIGYLAGQAINLGLSLLSAHSGGKGLQLFVTPIWFVLLTIGLSILIGLASGFWPAYRASKLSPMEAFLRR